MEQQLTRFTPIDTVDQNVGLRGITIFQVMRSELIVPLESTGFGFESEDAVGVQIVAGPVAVVAVRIRIACGPIKSVCGRIVGAGEPGGTAACQRLAPMPGFYSIFAPMRHRP